MGCGDRSVTIAAQKGVAVLRGVGGAGDREDVGARRERRRRFGFNILLGSFRSGIVTRGVGILPGLAGGEFGVVGLGWPGRGLGLERDKTAEGASELAVERDFVTEEEIRGAGVIGRVEGVDGTDGGWTEVGILEGHALVHGYFLHAPDAELTPAGDGHGFDEHHLSSGAGVVFGDESGEKLGETLRGFLFEDDGAGEEAVTEAVTGGVAFA